METKPIDTVKYIKTTLVSFFFFKYFIRGPKLINILFWWGKLTDDEDQEALVEKKYFILLEVITQLSGFDSRVD